MSFDASQRITKPIVGLISPRDNVEGVRTGRLAKQPEDVLQALAKCRRKAREERIARGKQLSELAESLAREVSQRQRLLLETAKQKGVSTWLTVDPAPQYGTVLNRSDFHDAVCLRYAAFNWMVYRQHASVVQP